MLEGLQGDILCLQETKVSRDMLTEPVALVKGFSSYFAFSRRRCLVTCHLTLDTWYLSPDTCPGRRSPGRGASPCLRASTTSGPTPQHSLASSPLRLHLPHHFASSFLTNFITIPTLQ